MSEQASEANLRWWTVWPVTLVSWGLLWLAFHPADLPVFGWFALAPWLALWKLSGRGLALPTIVGVWLYHGLRLTWVSEISTPPVFLIPIFGVPSAVLLAFGMRWLVQRRGWSLVAAAPLALVTADLVLETYLEIAWTSAGYSQWRWLEGLQTVPLFRVFLVAGLLYGCNGWLADRGVAILKGTRPGAALRGGLRPAIALVVVAALMHLFGAMKLAAPRDPDGPRALGVQPNVAQELRNARTGGGMRSADIWNRHFEVLDAHGPENFDADLLVTSETSFWQITDEIRGFSVADHLDLSMRKPDGSRRRAGSLFPSGRGQLGVLGYVRYENANGPPGTERKWNMAGIVRDGRELIGESAKRVLVPLGETIPGPEWLPFRDTIIEMVKAQLGGRVPNMERGQGAHPTHAIETDRGTWRFGTNICYEMVFPGQFHDLMESAPDFIVNISNDAWYRESSELDLVHVAGRFRALESGRAIFRVSNSGISTLADAQGRWLATVEQAGDRKAVPGVLAGTVPIASGQTLWVRFGDWPTGVVLLAGWVFSALWRRHDRADRV